MVVLDDLNTPYRSGASMSDDCDVCKVHVRNFSKQGERFDSALTWSIWCTILMFVSMGVNCFLVYEWQTSKATTKAVFNDQKGACHDALIMVNDNTTGSVCPRSEQRLDSAWLNGNRALCRCTPQ